MSELNTRGRNVLVQLLTHHGPVASAEVAAQLGLSPRQVRYALPAMEEWLEGRDAELLVTRGIGISIDASDSVRSDLREELGRLTSFALCLSQAERVDVLVFDLLTSQQPLTAEQLASRLGVSRATVFKDLEDAEGVLSRHGLRLERRPKLGLWLAGTEAQWRETAVSFLLDSVGQMALLALTKGSDARLRSRMNGTSWLLRRLCRYFAGLRLSFSRSLINLMAEELGLRFTDIAYGALIMHAALSVARVQEDESVEFSSDWAPLLESETAARAKRLVRSRVREELDLNLPEAEASYVALQVLCAKCRRGVHDVADIAPGPVDDDVLEAVDKVVATASTYLHPSLEVDSRLKRSLAVHLQTALKRMRLDLPIRNPMLAELQSQYPYLLKVARRSIAELKDEGGSRVADEEIGYIAMHLGAAMERLRPIHAKKNRVLVVCGEGLATAWLLVCRLQSELPDLQVVDVLSAVEVAEQHAFPWDMDAMISTVNIEIPGIPIVVVSPLLRAEDKRRIREVLDTGVPQTAGAEQPQGPEGPSLVSLLEAGSLAAGVRADDWRHLVETAGRLLLEARAIEPRYIQAMKQSIVEHGPYVVIRPGVALLHARPQDGVNRLCMALATVQEPVRFGHSFNDPVRIAVVLGAVDHRSHLRALAELARVLGNDDVVRAMSEASSKKELLQHVCAAADSA